MSENKKTYSNNADTVFSIILNICENKKFVLKSKDKQIRRIIMSTPTSILSVSFGEMIEIIVQPEIDGSSLVYIKSEPKYLFNIPARKAAEKNVIELFNIIDEELSLLKRENL